MNLPRKQAMDSLAHQVYALEDALDIIAKIPTIAAKIYRRTFQDLPGMRGRSPYPGNTMCHPVSPPEKEDLQDGVVPAYDTNLDWAANFAQMLGVNQDAGFKEAVRAWASAAGFFRRRAHFRPLG